MFNFSCSIVYSVQVYIFYFMKELRLGDEYLWTKNSVG